MRGRNVGWPETIRELSGRHCGHDNTTVYYSESKSKQTVVMFTDLSDDAFYTSKVLDPRLLGLYPASSPQLNLATRHLESFIGRQDREKVSVQHAQFAGHDAWLLKYRLLQGTGVDARVWVVPEWGPNPARIEAEWKTPEKHFMDSVECSYQQDAASKIWYPKTSKYIRTLNGDPEREEDVTVESLSVNAIVPSNALELSGMDIPVNTAILNHPDYRIGSFAWDGEKVVQTDKQPAGPAQVTSTLAGSRGPFWHTFFLCNSILLAICASFFIWRWNSVRR
jgi:hypothetical protein